MRNKSLLKYKTLTIIVLGFGLINVFSSYHSTADIEYLSYWYTSSDSMLITNDVNNNQRTVILAKKRVRPQRLVYKQYNDTGFHFAGVYAPTQNKEVNYQITKALSSAYLKPRNIQVLINRSSIYFPIIVPILKKYGIPEDFKYMPLLESGFVLEASHRGAVGPWQILSSSARNFGLVVNKGIDERIDIQKSTEAACRIIADGYRRYDSWLLAAASYNCGIGRIKKAVKQADTNNFFDLNINPQTTQYVYKLIAIKYMFEHMDEFGLLPPTFSTPQYVNTIETDTPNANISKLASNYGTSFTTLKELNPWLRSENFVNPERKKYVFVLPLKGK